MQATSYKKKHVDQHGLQGIATVSYKTYRLWKKCIVTPLLDSPVICKTANIYWPIKLVPS